MGWLANGDRVRLIWRVGINAETVFETYDLVETLESSS